MIKLVLNKFKVEIKNTPTKIYFSEELKREKILIKRHFLPRYKPTKILEWNFLTDDIKQWLANIIKEKIESEDFIYVSFSPIQNPAIKSNDVNFQDLPYSLQKKYLKENFIETLSKKYIIEPIKTGVDFSIYEKVKANNDSKYRDNIYTRFDLNFNIFKDRYKKINYEVTISVGSTDCYILDPKNLVQKNILVQNINVTSLKYLKDNFLVKYKDNKENIFNNPIKATDEIKKLCNITTIPKKKFYKEYYELINKFVNNAAKELNSNGILTLHTNFTKVLKSKISTVSFEKNKMIFKGNKEDYSTVNGMRDYGPYKIPCNIKETQFLFIYPDRESANRLYSYFSRGYKHFPGIESYVGIPANIYQKKINYENDSISIIHKIKDELTESSYSNVVGICIVPFSKGTATKKESEIYYQVKKTLLKKNIPSQFICRNKIFDENFHFSLPNIAIALLAKLGGIPWKLARPHYSQLTVGFNIHTNRDSKNTYLGSAVFFDNQGIIREVNGFVENNINSICEALTQAINKYKNNNNISQDTDNIVIHFFKTVSEKEIRRIQNVIKKELSKASSFAIVEINDTKTSKELCFDLEYKSSYMPQSGTYVRLKPNEYLLFNNLRYWEKPINPIPSEELPVKLKIYDPNRSFNHNELISQVYEFSRMYWKSLKQKAQPITSIYPKLIANYLAEFAKLNGELPKSEVAQKRVWFI